MHGGPVRWNDCFPGPFVQWPYWGIFSAKPTHSHAIFTLWVYIPTHLPLSHPFCSHWTNLPRKLLEVTSQIVWYIQCMLAIAFKAARELCRHWKFELILSRAETYHIFLKTILLNQVSQDRLFKSSLKDYPVHCICINLIKKGNPLSGTRTWDLLIISPVLYPLGHQTTPTCKWLQ